MSGCQKFRVSRSGLIATLLVTCGQSVATADGLTAIKLDDNTGPVWGVAISPDGTRFASVSDGKQVDHGHGITSTQGVLRIWETSKLRLFVETPLDDGQLFDLQFLPRGDRLAVGGAGALYIVQARDGKLYQRFKNVKNPVHAIDVSQDGSTLVSASLFDHVQFWNIDTGQLLKTATHDGSVCASISLKRDGRVLYAGHIRDKASPNNEFFVRLWDLGRPAHDLRLGFPKSFGCRNAQFISDERRIATLGWKSKVQEWDVTSGKLLRDWEVHPGAICMGVSRQAHYIATVSHDGSVRLWDAETAKAIGESSVPAGYPQAAAVSDDGQFVVVGTQDVGLWIISRTNAVSTEKVLGTVASPAAPEKHSPAALFPINPRPR